MLRNRKSNVSTAARRLLRDALVILTTVSVLSVSTRSQSLAVSNSPEFGGALSVRGLVNVNGQRAAEGQTLFKNARITTAANSESLITLINHSRLNLSAESELTIEASATRVFGSLETGGVLLDIPAGVALEFGTADVAINRPATEEAVVQIEFSECGGTRLTVMRGQIAARHHGRTEVVKARETLSTASGMDSLQAAQSSSNDKSKLGIFFAIGGAVAIILAVALGPSDRPPETPLDFGGSVVNPSPR